MTIRWRAGAGWFVRAAHALARALSGLWRGFLASAPAARLWAKILAVPALTAVLVHFVHLVTDRPWPRALAALQLQIVRGAIDWTALLAIICTAALAGVTLRARRGPAGAELELTETPADPPPAPPVSSPPA